MSGQGEKSHIQLKCLCDTKEGGGLQLPNLRLYYEVLGISWIQEWIKLENIKLLNLEGYNMKFGWHAYLFYQKYKNDIFKKHHIIRCSLHEIWQKCKGYIRDQRPLWLVPIEIITQYTQYDLEHTKI